MRVYENVYVAYFVTQNNKRIRQNKKTLPRPLCILEVCGGGRLGFYGSDLWKEYFKALFICVPPFLIAVLAKKQILAEGEGHCCSKGKLSFGVR